MCSYSLSCIYSGYNCKSLERAKKLQLYNIHINCTLVQLANVQLSLHTKHKTCAGTVEKLAIRKVFQSHVQLYMYAAPLYTRGDQLVRGPT